VIRRVLVALCGVAFVVGGLAIAQDPPGDGDDPPVRLKKRSRPDAAEPPPQEPQKPAEPPKEPKERLKPREPKQGEPKEGDDPGPAGDDAQPDEAEVLNRVGKNMRTSEDRLDHAELTDGTRQVQEDIIKDLDSLINQLKNGGEGQDQNDQQDQQGDQQNQQDKQQGAKQKQNGQTKIGMGKQKRSLRGQQQAKAQQGRKPAGQKPGQQQGQQAMAQNQNGGQNQQQGAQQPALEGGRGGQSEAAPSKLAEMYKDVWGHLPETMRAEMNAYSREQFMAKYNDLIKQYYSTVAEKSRKKE
jgi:hypothetical protein